MADLSIRGEDIEDNAQPFWDLLDTVSIAVNSEFMVERFVVNKEMPGRAWRQGVLELSEKAKALHHAGIERGRKEISLRKKQKEIEALLAKEDSDPDDIALLELDIRELKFELKYQEKLVKDAKAEVNAIITALSKLPQYTLEKFNAEEPAYWQKRLCMDAERELLQMGTVSAGTLDSFQKLGFDPIQVVAQIKESVTKQTQQLQAGDAKKEEVQPIPKLP